MYEPQSPPGIDETSRYLSEETRRIAAAINAPVFEFIQFKVLNAAPGKPRIGAVYLADGSNWDPLSVGGSDPYFVWHDGSGYHGLHETGNGANLT